MLQDLAGRINGTRLTEKDPDAEQFIQQTVGQNPDALYVMAQTILVQGYALQQAEKQLASARAQLDQLRQTSGEPKHATSFLGSLLGRHEEPAHAAAPPPPMPLAPPVEPQYGQPQGQYQQAPLYAPSGGYPLPSQPQGGGFLRGAMQTAAGVAAGSLAFAGMEDLLHGFGHGGGFGAPGLGTAVVESGRPEEVINNYYGDSAGHEHSADSSATAFDRHDDAWQKGDSGALHDASYVTSPGGDTDLTSSDSDDLSGTDFSDSSTYSDDSTLADDVGSQGDDGGDLGGDQSF